MAVFLDDTPIDTLALGHDASIGQALDAAKTRIAGSGRLILSFKCNDEDLNADEIEDILAAPVSEFERLEFISGRPEEMVHEALQSSRRAFEDTFPVVKETGDAIAAGDLSRAMSLLSDCFGIWGQAHESVITSGRLLGLDFNNVVVADQPLAHWMTQLSNKLKELKSAIEMRDHVLLGDIIRYELDATLQDWERMLGGLIDEIIAPRAEIPCPSM